jgi:hypothetical protein
VEDLPAEDEVAQLVFRDGFFGPCGFARATLPVLGLDDFLRIFLDIRLPFVAFGRSVSDRAPAVSQRFGHAVAVMHFWRSRGMVYKRFDERSVPFSAR